MNNVYNEPKYDTDMANKGYVDNNINKKIAVAMGDVEEDLSELDGKINTKTQNFGSQPTPPYHVNDSWMNGTDIYVCVNERLIGNFVASDWQKASTYDNTKSILDGGVTTDGTLVVAKGGTVAAGLTAYTSGDNGVRMWAGSDINGINSAPFRVTQAGYLYASNANIAGTITATAGTIGGCSITNGVLQVANANIGSLAVSKITAGSNSAAVSFSNITATGGTIGGWTLGSKKLESGSGTSYVRLDSNSNVGSAIWCGAEAATDAPFRVTKTGALYATSGTIGGCAISNGVLQVKSANISGTIAADKLDASVITTSNFSAQNINASKITSGSLSTAGVDIYNGTGFLRMLYSNWANHPYVSALNIAQGGGGLAFRTGQSRTSLGSTYGSLALLSGGSAYYLELGTASGVNLNFNSGDRIGMDSDGNDIRLGHLHVKESATDNTATLTTANDYSHARITLYNSGRVNLVATGSESVYAGSASVSSNKVLTGNSGASSKNVKKNIVPFTKEKYDKALKLLDNINLYDYEYKYDLYEDRKQYGFIIDEVEKLDKDSEFFKFYKDTANIEGEHLDFARENKDEPTIDVKFYNPDTLDKYLLTCIKGLQNKIEELEKEISQLKGGK